MSNSVSFQETPVEFCKGVGPSRAELLKKELEIFTFGDLLTFYPYRYYDRSQFQKISQLSPESSVVQIRGTLLETGMSGKGRATRLTAIIADDSGRLELVWFNGIKWIRDKLKTGSEFIVFGRPGVFGGKLYIPHPEIELATQKESLPVDVKLQPFYNSTEKLKSKGLDSRGIGKIMMNLVADLSGQIPENLPTAMLQKMNLPGREDAFRQIHFPENERQLSRATGRMKFEELFFIQLRLMLQKRFREISVKGWTFERVGDQFNNFYYHHLPFSLTDAQKKVIREIRSDMGSGKQMNRLLQGDVGSGKTLVALMCMLIALDNGFQSCLMAPTEILAIQHFNTLTKLLKDLKIEVRLLTGSVKGAARREILTKLSTGEVHLLVGTHALIEESVQFNRLGLAVIDEQHRFGVAQRARLWKKAEMPPHILVMTATPIPRTLAMTLYGDLDVSVIDELPPGRKPVKTIHFFDSSRLKVVGFIKEQIKAGRQVYIVFPLINESETLELKYLMEGYDSITREFPLPQYAVSMVHGQMKPQERDFEMNRFLKKETDIMVATTVIEVGVDVPNASVMVIENAERFGLSQLHQLRGRVGRGAEQSYCILMSGDKLSAEAKLRLRTMVETNDGFRIAETDLKLRGPGDIEGLRQSGIVDLHIADIVKDEKILKYARQMAAELLENDPELKSDFNRPVRDYIRMIHRRKGSWGMIS